MKLQVERILEKTSKQGKEYLSILSNDQWYGVWEDEVISQLRNVEGREIDVEVEQRGNFVNITEVNSISPSEPTVKTSPYQEGQAVGMAKKTAVEQWPNPVYQEMYPSWKHMARDIYHSDISDPLFSDIPEIPKSPPDSTVETLDTSELPHDRDSLVQWARAKHHLTANMLAVRLGSNWEKWRVPFVSDEAAATAAVAKVERGNKEGQG